MDVTSEGRASARPRRNAHRLSLLLGALLATPLIAAGQTDGTPFREQIGDYTLIYSAVRSDSLPEEMAQRHGLPADSSAVLLNVTVQQDGRNVSAQIDAQAVNLVQQVEDIDMRETEADGLVSYVGVVEIAEREVLDFELVIRPQNAVEPIRLEFRETFLPGREDASEVR